MKTALLCATALCTMAACNFEPAAPSASLAAQLHRRAFLDVSTASNVDVSAVAHGQTVPVQPDVLGGGQAVLRTTDDGWLLVEDLDIPLDDVTVPAGVIADRPVTFTDITLRLGTQLAVQPVGDGQAALAGWGDADLLLDWSMRSWDGKVLPLAMRRIAGAPFAVAVDADADGRLHAAISARVDGVVDDLGEVVVLRDLAVDVVGGSPAPVVR